MIAIDISALLIFADVDPLGGWAQIILQGGAFSLLVYIVAVLYPQSAKDVREERERRDTAFSAMIDRMNDKFDQRNNLIVTALEKQTVTMTASFREGMTRIESSIEASAPEKGVRSPHK